MNGEKNMTTTYHANLKRIKVITSFGPGGWDKYAKKFVESFVKYWPADVQLEVWYHDTEKPHFINPRVHFRSLHEIEAHEVFVESASPISNPQDYRYDVVKFGHKVYAVCNTVKEDWDWLIWLDADIETTSGVTRADISGWLAAPDGEEELPDVVHLDRKTMTYSETSFVAYNLMKEKACSLLVDMNYEYETGEVLLFREWHDGFVFERLLRLHQRHDLLAKSLTTEGYLGLEAFMNSPLGARMIHYKGPVAKGEMKEPAAPQPTGPQRYKQLEELVEFYGSKVIAETGTWSGDRAIAMSRAALIGNDKVHYIGFDLFEGATKETDAEEFNTKRHFTVEDVRGKLSKFKEEMIAQGKEFTFELVQGDTKVTLPKRAADISGVDFAYLDGGHSDETVENDWFYFQHVDVVVFDDYFMPDPEGKMPAEEHCGTNNVLAKHALEFEKLPSFDRVLHGGITHLALVRKEGVPDPKFKRMLRINPQDCVPKEEIHSNMDENQELIGKWVKHCKTHKGEAVIVSGGPSVKKHLDTIKELYDNGAYIFCVKHSLNTLMDAGITPYGCVILDPRDVEGTSTHGFNRKELLRFPAPGVRYFVASMTHPSVTKHLKENNGDVVGWHAYSQSGADYLKLPKGEPTSFWITGGTCSAYRAVGVCHTIGFRAFHLFGFDLCWPEDEIDKEEKDAEGRAKYFKLTVGDKSFYTTGEMMAAAQDFENFCKSDLFTNLDVEVYGDGVVPAIWNSLEPGDRPDFREVIGEKYNYEQEIV